MDDKMKLDLLKTHIAEAKRFASELGSTYFSAMIHFDETDAPLNPVFAGLNRSTPITTDHGNYVAHHTSAMIDSGVMALIVERKEPIQPQPESQASQDSMRDLGTY